MALDQVFSVSLHVFFHEATLDLPDFVSTLVLLHLSFNCSVLENANHTLKWVIIAPLSVRLIACKEEEEGKKKRAQLERKLLIIPSFSFLILNLLALSGLRVKAWDERRNNSKQPEVNRTCGAWKMSTRKEESRCNQIQVDEYLLALPTLP